MPHTFGLSDAAQNIFKNLYSFSDETIEDTFNRVAKEFAKNEEEFKLTHDLLATNTWRANTPVFFNAGTDHKMFSACWVVGLDDSMNNIYDIANVSRKIFQHGAGIGIPIGNLREKDAFIYEGKKEVPPTGKSSGPVSFMKLYDVIGESTKSGGRTRRAAILCSMPVNHPDIMEFIGCKEVDGKLSNMNISVSITDKFMQALKDGISYQLISPSNGEVMCEVNSIDVWNKLVDMSWKTADPGVLFIDTINKYNPLKSKIQIQCTNPCGEQPLIPFTSCNLSSINVHKFCINGKFDFEKLYTTAYNIMILMDNIIDVMYFPDKRFEDNVKKYRPVGVGIMGLADALFELDLKYDGLDGRQLAGEIMKTITTACISASADLAAEKGKFFNYDKYESDTLQIIAEHTGNNLEIIEKVKKNGLRNIQFTTCAPTGTTALSCDCSYGIEPCFGLVFQKNMITGEVVLFVNPIFKKKYEGEPWYDDKILEKIFQNGGTLKGLRGIPKEVRDIYITAHDIKYKDRIDMQSELQKYCSSAISSTINLPNTVTKEEVSDLYRYAYEKGLKGVTIYRDGSKHSQPITFSKNGTEVKSNFSRPNKLVADTHVLETGNGKLYVIVSKHNGKPVEIFMNMGKSGQLFNVFTESLGRVISIALQHGVPMEEIIKTMMGINSDRPTWFRFDETDQKPVQILSIPDGLAKLLQRFYTNGVSENNNDSLYELCPKCGTYSLVIIEGCKVCQNCGESACG